MKERAFRPGSDSDPQRIAAGKKPRFADSGSVFEPGHRMAVKVKIVDGWHQLPAGWHRAFYNRDKAEFWIAAGGCGHIAVSGAKDDGGDVEAWSQLAPKPFGHAAEADDPRTRAMLEPLPPDGDRRRP